MASNFNKENDPWESGIDIDDSDLHLTLVLRSSSSTRVEPSPLTPNQFRIVSDPAGIIQISSSTRVEPSFSTPNPVRIIPGHAVVEDVGYDDDFKSGVWVSVTNYVTATGGTVIGCLGDIKNFLKKEKLDELVAIVKSCSPNDIGDLNVTMKDLSGAAIILANVSDFTHKPSKYYLNITMRNVVNVFHNDTVPRNDSVDGFVKMVEDTWNVASGDSSNAIFNLMNKLNFLKQKIRAWNFEWKNSSKSHLVSSKLELAHLDALIDNGEGTEATVQKKTTLVDSILKDEKLHSMEVAQKAKIKWVIEGDENSKFYHGILNNKRNQLSIRGCGG
nr:hypothetical protein [Tanacetum cinerariifolium]